MDITLKASEIPPDLMQFFEPVDQPLKDVWNIPTQPFKGSHFATFPEELIRRTILASTPDAGVCAVCGSPWARVVESGQLVGRGGAGKHDVAIERAEIRQYIEAYETNTLGWRPTCLHSEAQPATILDPFGGSMTSAVVARSLGRRFVCIELSADYVQMGMRRLTLTQPAMAGLV